MRVLRAVRWAVPPLELGALPVGAMILCFGTEEPLSSGQPGPGRHSLG